MNEEYEYYKRLVAYAGKYEITVQFWGPSDTNVFIAKDGIDLIDFGGLDALPALTKAVEYLDRINNKKN